MVVVVVVVVAALVVVVAALVDDHVFAVPPHLAPPTLCLRHLKDPH